MSEGLFEGSSRSFRLLAVGRGRLGYAWGAAREKGERNFGKIKPDGVFLFLLKVTLEHVSLDIALKYCR